MNILGELETKLYNGEITEEEYKEKKAVYTETILQLYIRDIISKEKMNDLLNK